MDIRVMSREGLRAERAARDEIVERIPYGLRVGENDLSGRVVKRIAKGEMQVFRFAQPVGELLTTPDGLDSLVQKTVLDLEEGRELEPLLYGPIYRRRENRDFTRDVRVNVSSGRARAVFLEHLEGEEIKFGDRRFGVEDTVPIITYATGFQWTEDMIEFDLSWEAEEANRAMGEAYNALLNHLHLFPIIAFDYAAKNQTAAQTYPGADPGPSFQNDRQTLKVAFQDAALDKNLDTGRVRRPTVILAHPSNQFRLVEALQPATIGGTQFSAIGGQISQIILYDGYSETVGEKTYEYPGVPTDRVFAIDAQRYFHELVKHDLRVDAGGADITRLIEEATVGRTRRGVYAVPANAVQEITLP